MKRVLEILFIVLMFFMVSCSSSIEETREEEVNDSEDGYVFDEIPENENVVIEYYQVQIGAFTTKQRADLFAEESKKQIKNKITVEYNSEVNLFVVRVDKEFKTKKEAEEYKNNLAANNNFKDAWIVTLNK